MRTWTKTATTTTTTTRTTGKLRRLGCRWWTGRRACGARGTRRSCGWWRRSASGMVRLVRFGQVRLGLVGVGWVAEVQEVFRLVLWREVRGPAERLAVVVGGFVFACLLAAVVRCRSSVAVCSVISVTVTYNGGNGKWPLLRVFSSCGIFSARTTRAESWRGTFEGREGVGGL